MLTYAVPADIPTRMDAVSTCPQCFGQGGFCYRRQNSALGFNVYTGIARAAHRCASRSSAATGKAPLNVYRAVSEAGKTGWQPMRPAGFRAVPYFHQDANPFDGE